MDSNLSSINQLCNLISKTFSLTTFFIDPSGEVMFDKIYHKALNPLYKHDKQQLFSVIEFNPDEKYDFPLIKKSYFLENYINISVIRNEKFEGTVIVGPILSHRLPDNKINGFINDTKAYFIREQIFDYYNAIPIIENDLLVHISVVIFHVLNNRLLSPEFVMSKNTELLIKPMKNRASIDLIRSKNIQLEPLYLDPLHEKERMDIIREGRIEKLKDYYSSIDEEIVNILSKSSYIRSLKNQIISLITLVSRAAIDGGLPYDISYSLSNTFIIRLEELNKVSDIKQLAWEVLLTFTEKVAQIKNNQYSKSTIICKNYILNHLYEDIELNELAELIGLSSKYLSAQFKKETGFFLSDYIQYEKIEEAKKLLSYTQTPISEISSLLNFTDQSYFTKVFKKLTKLTPKQYRDRFGKK